MKCVKKRNKPLYGMQLNVQRIINLKNVQLTEKMCNLSIQITSHFTFRKYGILIKLISFKRNSMHTVRCLKSSTKNCIILLIITLISYVSFYVMICFLYSLSIHYEFINFIKQSISLQFLYNNVSRIVFK